MISRLNGKVVKKNLRFAIIECGGVGYKVYSPVAVLEKLREESEAILWTSLAVRENSLDLYGFEKEDELEFFELLNTVSGIGPKTALSILNIASPKALERAISSGDTTHLVKVSGIGKKNAEKIVIELRDKLGALGDDYKTELKDEVDAIEALKALGYSPQAAREALKEVSKEINGTNEKIREALKILGAGSGVEK